jgi:hypothetical protein
MQFILTLVFDYDATDWATEYGLADAEATGDFTAVLRRTVADDGLRRALNAAWPMMRGHITVHTLDQLDAGLRDELLHQLREARDADQHAALLTEIRGYLAAHPDELSHREPRWVVFHTDEWDNGHFLTADNAKVYSGDGDCVTVDFDGTRVDELLTDAYGTRGGSAALGVDLTTAATEFDDYGDNVPDLLGIPSANTHAGNG